MYLITTADQRYWKTDRPILFLGEWCKLFSQRFVWEELSFEVLPYHWDDRKKLYQDYLYLDKLYVQTLLQMKDHLNRIHGVDHSLRYWMIVIGPWLYYFIQVLYDRYQSIIMAIDSKKVTNCLIGKYIPEYIVSKDFTNLPERFVSDDYNHYLYSRIIEFTNKIPYDIIEVIQQDSVNYNSNNSYLFDLKRLGKKIIVLYEKLIPNRFNQIVVISSHLNIWNLIKLQLTLGQLPYLVAPDVEHPTSNINWNLRNKFYFASSGYEFEELLNEMIKEQIPSIYLEGYHQMNQLSLNAYPKHPKVIFNSTEYHLNESFKFWAAYHVDRCVKFAGIQHGGHYGTGLWSSIDDHEMRIYDRFYTWGWKSDVYKNTKPISSSKLSGIKKSIRPLKKGRLLMALMTMPRYSYAMYSTPVSSTGTLAYFNEQYRFVRCLSQVIQKLLLVRLYHLDWRWNQKERWLSEFPEIECYSGNRSMLTQLNESRLFIGTYNATTYLETFSANFPTILFWNPTNWEIRPSAKPYFDELRSVGILHDTPESAAVKTSEIYHDSMSWWQKPDVQTAKNNFCYQFAKTSDNWMQEWKNELSNLSLDYQK